MGEAAETFWGYFETAVAAHPGDPRTQILAFLEGLAERTQQAAHRGCPLTNAVVEYPERGHPARIAAQDHKAELRARLRSMAAEMGADDGLGDALLLLIEGAYITTQLFDEGRPTGEAVRAAERLMAAYGAPARSA
jgi:hypothetical protein